MNKQAILCIDDEVIVLDSLKEQLQIEFGNEYIIEIAESGEEALEIVQDFEEDSIELPVVIADFIMPGMKGDELLERIYKKKPVVRNILLTGQASLQGVGNAVNRANLYRFLSKPWDKDDLLLTVKEALRSYNQDKTILKQNEELKQLNAGLELKVEQRTRELKELNATKDRFFSIIAHDLKNPFNTLMGFSQLLLESLEAFDKKQINEFASIMHSTSKNAYSLLENLLEWSRSQTGRIIMEPSSINLYNIVEENFELLLGIAEKKKITLKNEVENNLTAFADQNMIRTVVRNLISNALKYTNENGTIKVTCKPLDDKVELIVSDTGIGIKEENLKKLFRIDLNFSTKGTNEEAGTGLGLILCKEFVLKNRGGIEVKSTLGKGSEFIIHLPTSSA